MKEIDNKDIWTIIGGVCHYGLKKWVVYDFNSRSFFGEEGETHDIFKAELFEDSEEGLEQAKCWALKTVKQRYSSSTSFFSRVIVGKVNMRYFVDFQTINSICPQDSESVCRKTRH